MCIVGLIETGIYIMYGEWFVSVGLMFCLIFMLIKGWSVCKELLNIIKVSFD